MTSEAAAIAQLPGGPLPYTLRRSSRARVLRVVIHPDRGVVVTVPARTVRPEHEHRAAAFLAQREPWLRKHLGLQAEAQRVEPARLDYPGPVVQQGSVAAYSEVANG